MTLNHTCKKQEGQEEIESLLKLYSMQRLTLQIDLLTVP